MTPVGIGDCSPLAVGALRSKSLEDRRLLSAGLLESNLVSLAAATAGANRSTGNVAVSEVASAAAASASPTISNVVISQSAGIMSWNVSNVTPVASTTLQIDGVTVSGVAGPYKDASGGVNFSASISSLATGLHSYLITATDTAGDTTSSSSTFTISATTSATSTPVISQIVVSQDTGRVSWNVLVSGSVSVSTLAIDGVSIPYVLGPYTASSGVNFSGPLTILTIGTHSLTITATSNSNVTSTITQSFSIVAPVTGPVVSDVVVTPGTDTITWHAEDASGVTASTLAIDGRSITVVTSGTTFTGADFSASLGLLNAGLHPFTITATDTLSQVSTMNANFVLDSQTSVGPTVGLVVASESKAIISWNALDSTGVTATTLSIDGVAVSSIFGPFTAASGVNFSAPLDSLTAGTHTYAITAFDGVGSQGTASGTFTLAGTTTYDPMIRQVVIAQTKGIMSWNVFDPNGVRSSTLAIDGVTVKVSGPFTASSGVNFSGSLAGLAVGSHTYRITTTDNLGRQSTALANFSIAASTAASATQSDVFSSIGNSAATDSAKVAWLLDLGGLADSTSSATAESIV